MGAGTKDARDPYMKRLRISAGEARGSTAALLIGALLGCGPGEPGADAGLVDAGGSDGSDFQSYAPTSSTAARPLFLPDRPGAPAIDRPLANLVTAWQTVPATEADAQTRVRALRTSRAALAAAGAAGADRITQVCKDVGVELREHTLVCLRLLALTESPSSIAFLGLRARTAARATPEGEGQLPSPERLARRGAVFALGRRALEGSAPATELLLSLASDPGYADRGLAVDALFGALPRWSAKAKLRRVMPPSERWRLFEAR